MSDFFQLASGTRRQIAAALGGIEADVNLVSNVVTELARCCERATQHTPLLDTQVVFPNGDSSKTARVVVSDVPCVTHSAATSVVALAPQAIYRVRFVFRNETDQRPLFTGRVEIDFWRAANTERERLVYTPPRRAKTRRRDVEIDYTDLNASTDDCANIERVMDLVHHMAPVMPLIGVSCEPLLKTVNGATGGGVATSAQPPVPRKRARRADAVDEETAISEPVDGGAAAAPIVDRHHVGFCLFFTGVPNFDSNFLDYLKTQLGNLVLEAVVLAPVRWTVDSANGGGGGALDTPHELAVSLRRAKCTEAESGPYCIDGSRRLVRVMTRNAQAFKGVLRAPATEPNESNGNAV